MNDIEQEIRLEVSPNQIEKIRKNSEIINKRIRMIDITCGKYGFDSLANVGYICRIRAKNSEYLLEVKNYFEEEKCTEKSLKINSIQEGLEFLNLLGMEPYLVLDRYREVRKYNDLLIFIDEFQDDIGNYVEIEYQNSDRESALNFVRNMELDLELKDKYGDIVKKKLKNDKSFEQKFVKSLERYKYKL